MLLNKRENCTGAAAAACAWTGSKKSFRSRGGQEKEKIKSTHPILEITHSPSAGFSLGFAIAIRRRGEIKARPQK